MIMSIVDYHHWPPSEINKMFCDDVDFKGIVYWYDELIKIKKKMKQKN